MEEGRKGRGQRRFEERGGGSSDGISISKELTSVFQFHQIQPYYQSGRKHGTKGVRERCKAVDSSDLSALIFPMPLGDTNSNYYSPPAFFSKVDA